MKPEQEQMLREKEMAFFGAITASLSHQINNVFTIINELNGLLQDCLFAASTGQTLSNQKLHDISIKTTKQIERGTNYVKRLNQFAHSVDHSVDKTDLKELLLRITKLCQRFAALKKVELTTTFDPQPIIVETNTFRIQQAVFLCLQLALDSNQQKKTLTIRCQATGSDAQITIAGVELLLPDIQDQPTWSLVTMVMEQLHGRAVFVTNSGTGSFEMHIPLSPIVVGEKK